MRRFLLFVGILAFGSVLDIFPAHAASPSFSVSAMNTTMPSSGNGSIPVTLSSVDGYAGSIVLQCPEVNAGAGARVPTCGGGPLRAYDLAANQMIQTSLPLVPYGEPVPASIVAGALLLGVGLRRRRRRVWWFAPALLGSLAGFGGMIGCGGGPGMTPGAYTYTITATDLKTNVVVSTTAGVIVR